jgi:hypothetical protein
VVAYIIFPNGARKHHGSVDTAEEIWDDNTKGKKTKIESNGTTSGSDL